MKLLSSTNTTPDFSLENMILKGKVVECYDGDTCKIVLDIFDNITKFTCRLEHIDTPELKPSLDLDINVRKSQISRAKLARNKLLKLITKIDTIDENISKNDIIKLLNNNTNLVTVKCGKFDKYGRLLVELYENEQSSVSYNSLLIDTNLAVKYEGGTKEA